MIKINSKGIGNKCSSCGAEGRRERGDFICESCGVRLFVALNGARNIEKKCTVINKQNSEDK